MRTGIELLAGPTKLPISVSRVNGMVRYSWSWEPREGLAISGRFAIMKVWARLMDSSAGRRWIVTIDCFNDFTGSFDILPKHASKFQERLLKILDLPDSWFSVPVEETKR